MKTGTIAAMAALAVAVSGCASIVRGSSETISIHSVPANGAVCTLSNPRGTWRVSTPGRVRVKRSAEDMDVTCIAPGYTDATGTISSDFETWTLGNVLIGGLVGLVVDWSTGSVNRYDHQFDVQMYPAEGVQPAYPAGGVPPMYRNIPVRRPTS